MVRKEDVVYIVDEKNRKVVAFVEGAKYELVDFIQTNGGVLPDWMDQKKLYDKLLLPNKFVGVAFCGPNDEWNPEIGKLVAYHRMKTNMSKCFFNRAETYYREMLKNLDSTIDKINAYGKKLSINFNRRVEKINEILGEVEDNEPTQN